MEISRLQYISQEGNGKTHLENCIEACEAGIDWVQLRIKNKTQEEIESIALDVRKVCTKYKAKFIINDHVAVAKKVKADGIHIGKLDMSINEAKEIVGHKIIIGGTANTVEDVFYLNSQAVDYIGYGPFRFTTTKENLSSIVGLEGFKFLMDACKKWNYSIPIIGIGGIVVKDIESLKRTGIYGVAVSSSINLSLNKLVLVKEFQESLNN